jgi:hypothetical protein
MYLALQEKLHIWTTIPVLSYEFTFVVETLRSVKSICHAAVKISHVLLDLANEPGGLKTLE